MCIRYQTLAKDPKRDPLRPKNISNNIDDYVECSQLNPEEFKEIYNERNPINSDFCCRNCCLYAIYNLTQSESWQDHFLPCIKLFRHKKMHVIYIVGSYKYDLAQKLNEKKFNHNGSILTEEKYNILVHASLGGKTLFESTKYIKDTYKPSDPSEKLHISVYYEMRKSMEEIIYFYLRLCNIEKFSDKTRIDMD